VTNKAADAGALEQVIPGLGITDNELLDSMGGVTEVIQHDNRLYTAEWAKTVAAMPRVPVYIPGESYEWVQVNGMTFQIAPEQVVMVPQVVKEVLDNKRLMEQSVARQQKMLKKAMVPSSINDIPEYVG
jgi:hypothetical protein